MIGAVNNSSQQFQHAVILGGGGMRLEAYQKAIELAGGPENARVGVITAAADGGRHFSHADYYTSVFKKLGVKNVVTRLEALAKAIGPRFAPGDALRRMAERDGAFYA